jgi:hypothetical protein
MPGLASSSIVSSVIGEHWFNTRPEAMGTVPFERSFKKVDKFLKRFKKLRGKYQRSNNPDFTEDLWEAVSFIHLYESRNTNALPRTYKDLQSALLVGSAESFLPYSVKSIDWLNEHGRCMDNIRPGKSTIEQAGRGAFSSRFIPEGGLVAPGPLLHIPNRTALNMYEMDPYTGLRDTNRQIGMQLILNYCFGNSKSSVILCPYTSPSAYINHSSKAPNAKIVWAKDSTPNHNADWLQEDVKFLKTMNVIGLSIDFVATRDIQPGEEVFIDYGIQWEEAWNKYVKDWKPPRDADDYSAGAELQNDLTMPLRTLDEQKEEPYAGNIVFYCHYDYFEGVDEGPWEWAPEWEGHALYPCELTARHSRKDEDGNAMYYYSAVMLTDKEIPPDVKVYTRDVIPEGEIHVMTSIPRSAVVVRDRMYSKDEYAVNAFRHEMMMPDDMFPETWMNL